MQTTARHGSLSYLLLERFEGAPVGSWMEPSGWCEGILVGVRIMPLVAW